MSITEVESVSPAVPVAPRLRSIADRLASLVADLDGAELLGSEAALAAVLFAEVERLAMAGKTVAAARVAESGHHRAAGFASAPQWLAARTGATASEAARTVATGRWVSDPGLAATRSALIAGALTAAQAHEVAWAAAGAPAEQERLLALAARETAGRLRDECRKVRLAGRGPEDPAKRRKRITDEMAFGHRDLGEGLSELYARMPTSWLVLVLAAVRTQCDAVFAQARAEGRDDAHQAYLVEALVTLLLLGPLDAGVGTAGDDELYEELLAAIRGAPADGVLRRRRRARRGRCRCGGRVTPRAKIIVRVDQSALLRGHAEGDEVCDIAGVGPVSVATVRELWPDAVVKAVITRGVDVVNVTSFGRRAIEAFTTAMQFTSPGCTNIACDNEHFVQVDHRLGYANVHRTRLDELDPLCTSCHPLKTNENWQLVRGTGRRRFVPPTHPDHPGDPPTPRRAAA